MKPLRFLFVASAALLFARQWQRRKERAAAWRRVSRFTRSGGIGEEIELRGDGTFRQTITDLEGRIFHNSGTWNTSDWFGQRFGERPSRLCVTLEKHVDALEVVRRQSVDAAKKKAAAYPLYAFRVPHEEA